MKRNVIIATLIAVLGLTAAAPASSPVSRALKIAKQSKRESAEGNAIARQALDRTNEDYARQSYAIDTVNDLAKHLNGTDAKVAAQDGPPRIEKATSTVLSGGFTRSVDCPAGTRATGGGYKWNPITAQVAAVAPEPTATGYQVSGINPVSNSGAQLTVEVVCIP